MLRIIENRSAGQAKSYYGTADYYSEGQELVGQWRGKGAQRLGLSGTIQKQDWDRLCDNRDPATGRTLTQRRKQVRRVGYDFNFHVPKSFSLLYGLTRDPRLLDAFEEAVEKTMSDMEREMKTRVRRGGRNEDRTTGNMIWGQFVHFCARPVDGIPDPHLHAHCFVFSATADDMEGGAWKAGQFADLKRDAPYFEALFHCRLAHQLSDLGIATVRTKSGWEIAGLASPELTGKFSRRTDQIEKKAKAKGITDPREKSELGAKTRERKNKQLSMDELRAEWESRLSDEQRKQVEQVKIQIGCDPITQDQKTVSEAAQKAIDHCFERKSVVPERELLREALKLSVGQASETQVLTEVAAQNLVIAPHQDRRLATTAAVLQEERSMIDFARRGRGTRASLGGETHVFDRDWLNPDQQRAVLHVLQSRDRVILIRGAAGVGKTTMMQEAVQAVEAKGHKVFTFAPSADASRGVLRQEGFDNADTVARLLTDRDLQNQVRGAVLWVDEAGLLGTRTMGQFFDLAEKLDARVILSGDRRQHGSVERGSALRLLETEAGLVPAELKEIQRQKGSYKQAVHALSEGRIEDGFDQLDQLGWIREMPSEERYGALAADYAAAVAAGKSALVVSPTHREADRITRQIRSELRAIKKLGQDERPFVVLQSMNLTEAQRADGVNYQAGDVLVFHQNAKGHVKSERVVVGEGPFPLDQADRFQAFHAGLLSIAPGDVVRITRNGSTADGLHRLNNGALYKVRGFDDRGNLVLNNGWTVSRDFGHLAYGYVVTSHASQGKTVDRVFIGQSADSRPASSRQQFYVSVSRAREQAVIYTDDKRELLEAVRRCDERLTATEFVSDAEHRARAVVLQRTAELMQAGLDEARRERQREEPVHERW